LLKKRIMVSNYLISEENVTGCCPECGHSWDKGDVFEFMKERNPNLSDEVLLKNVKNNFGWTPETPKRFSHLVFIEPSDGDEIATGANGYYQCPNCQIAWESETGERTDKYKSMLAEDSAMKAFIENLKRGNK
jgi:hypothetical protein